MVGEIKSKNDCIKKAVVYNYDYIKANRMKITKKKSQPWHYVGIPAGKGYIREIDTENFVYKENKTKIPKGYSLMKKKWSKFTLKRYCKTREDVENKKDKMKTLKKVLKRFEWTKRFIKHRLKIKDILKLKKGQKIDIYLENNINKKYIFEKKIKYDEVLKPEDFLKSHKAVMTYMGDLNVKITQNGKTKTGTLSILYDGPWRFKELDKNGDIEITDDSGIVREHKHWSKMSKNKAVGWGHGSIWHWSSLKKMPDFYIQSFD